MQLVSHAIDICLPQEQERINLIAFNLLSIAFDAEEKQGERRKRSLLRDAISLIGLDIAMR